MLKLLCALLLFSPLMGFAGELEDTAVRAFQDVQTRSHSHDWEYGGAIIYRNGELYYSAFAHTDRRADYFNPTSTVKSLLASDILVALYHTHPCIKGYFTNLFSMNDIIVQLYWDVPAFMLDQCTMQVHEFQMGVDHVWDTGNTVTLANGKRMHLPAGRIVGKIDAR